MARYSLRQIAEFTGGKLSGNPDLVITDLAYDSRNLVAPRSSLFFALKGAQTDGHHYISKAHKKGVRAFIVHSGFQSELDASFIRVEDTFLALQWVGAHHRKTIDYPIIGLTGSNGKTTVKEWLTQVLRSQFSVSASPRSYNSQLGVPLSLWTLDPAHDYGIIEAGISKPKEMDTLAELISPQYGIFTHLGDAHMANFSSQKELITEKIKLFSGCEWVVVNSQEKEVISELRALGIPTKLWGASPDADVCIHGLSTQNQTVLEVIHQSKHYTIHSHFTDKASVENMCHVISAALLLGASPENICEQITHLEPLDMRMQVMKGINNCILINDSYTADITALENALDLGNKYAFNKTKTLIISDFSGGSSALAHIKKLISEKGISRLITLGKTSEALHVKPEEALHFSSAEGLIEANLDFINEVVIIKGARSFKLEKIAHRLQLQDHQTVLEINLNAFTENLAYYREKLQPNTKIMAMVKAFSYGSGSFEVASHLQNLGVNYLAVAYTDEGVELRKNGIHIPVLVLNPEPSAFDSIIRYGLEPEIYSLDLLDKFLDTLALQNQKKFPIHIKLDSGMHRLGMEHSELDELISKLKTDLIEVKSVFSHLAASDDPKHDAFSRTQIQRFLASSAYLCENLDAKSIRHICNSSAISRFPEAHLDMVRLGIGLYGITSVEHEQTHLKLAGKLSTKIIQIRHLSEGESVGYNRDFLAHKDTTIGIIPIGYADGIFRSLGNGKSTVTVRNQKAPIVGTICMDMMFIDITDLTVSAGDEVIIFQNSSDIKALSAAASTIPYEILSSLSHRVKRTFFLE